MFANPNKQYLVGALRVVVDRLTFVPAHTKSPFVGPHCSRPAYPRLFAQVLRSSPLIGLETLGNASSLPSFRLIAAISSGLSTAAR